MYDHYSFEDAAAYQIELSKTKKLSSTEINSHGETLGFALRTKLNCAPVYVSAGHLITADQSLTIIKIVSEITVFLNQPVWPTML